MLTTGTAGDDRTQASGRTLVVVVALCGVAERDGAVLVDTKFHTGMVAYSRLLRRPLACLVPRLAPEAAAASGASLVPRTELPYELHAIGGTPPRGEDAATVAALLDRTALAYVGEWSELNWELAAACRARGIPYVTVTEYTLRTTLDIMRAQTTSRVRRAVRALRLRAGNRRRLELVRGAAEVHANGFPTHRELAPVNPRRLLFFDTRATAADVLAQGAVLERLASLAGRPARLLYSGRYHPMKGALDVVRTGVELARRGVDFHLDTYGAGPQKDEMVALARSAGEGRIRIHDPVPYRPDLIEHTRAADLFVACHVQGDPSCTYLETFACGVPVAGYANEMWGELARASGAGAASPLGEPAALAAAIERLLRDPDALRDASLRARAFALEHTMDAAWQQRTEALEAVLERGAGAVIASRRRTAGLDEPASGITP